MPTVPGVDVSFIARGHPQQLKHRDPAIPRLPGMELPDVPYDIDDRGTDPAEFAKLNARFRFTVDIAASPHNAKLENFYTIEDDGLTASWAGERVWCNPPYSNIRPWIEKAWEETAWSPDGFTSVSAPLIVMLLPANRTEQGWWQELVEPYRGRYAFDVEFLPGRMRFIAPGADRIGANERPPFGCCLLIWGDSCP
jgi:phage N-6-adenine-methyltransferase